MTGNDWYARQDSNLRPLAPEANGSAVNTPEITRGQIRGHDDDARLAGASIVLERAAELMATWPAWRFWYGHPAARAVVRVYPDCELDAACNRVRLDPRLCGALSDALWDRPAARCKPDAIAQIRDLQARAVAPTT